MFFTNDYMQNLNYYNQNPYGGDDFYNNRTNGLYYRNSNNINTSNGFNSLNNFNNLSPFNNMGNKVNLNMLYPEIYRVIYPVVQNILDNTNIGIVDDKFINSIVKNVLSILEGDNRVRINNNIANNNNNDNINTSIDNNNTGSNNVSNNNSTNTNEENFLEELVKVIVVKEIISIINRLNLNSFIQNNML